MQQLTEFQQLATDFLTLVTSELDPHTSNKGRIKGSSEEVSLYTPSHIHFAKYGRASGKPPPFASIYKWVKNRGILFTGKTPQQTATAIMWSIAKNGTKNFQPGKPDALQEAITIHADNFNKELADYSLVEFDKWIKDEYRKIPTLNNNKPIF